MPSQLLINLCAALFVALVLFVLASQASGTKHCRVWAVAMHYFWLAAVGWMVVMAVNLHGVVVIVIGLDMTRRLRAYYSLAWGESAVTKFNEKNSHACVYGCVIT